MSKVWTALFPLFLLIGMICFPATGLSDPLPCNGFLNSIGRFFGKQMPQEKWVISLTQDYKGASPEVFHLREKYRGEEVGGPEVEERTHFKNPIQYLSIEEAKSYQLKIKDGRFYAENTELLCVNRLCEGIIVVDTKGHIFFSTFFGQGKFHHSSLIRGESVLFAGDAVFENGVLKVIDNQSGHYHPEVRSFKFLIEALQQNHISDYMVGLPYRDPESTRKLHEHLYFHSSEVLKLFITAPREMSSRHLFDKREIELLKQRF